MHSSTRLFRFTSRILPTLLLASGLPSSVFAQKAESAKKPAVEGKKNMPAEPLKARPDAMARLFNIVQVGRTHEGVHMPISEDGKITTVVDAEKMTRVDEHNIAFEQAVINQRAKDGSIVRMPRGYYNKENDLLLSTLPAIVENPEYRIEGDALTVDRRSNTFRMDGRVRFMFFGKTNLGSVSATKDESAHVTPVEPEPEPTAPSSAPASGTTSGKPAAK